jgi:hypothetical protein
LSPDCFKAKVDRHIARQRANDAGLVQITRAYYSNTKGEDKVLTRNDYTIVASSSTEPDTAQAEGSQCEHATKGIVVEGPGKRGEIVQICANSECPIHGMPNYRAEQEAVNRHREEEWRLRQEQQRKITAKNLRLFEAVLAKAPRKLAKADLEMFACTAIRRLEYEHLDILAERHGVKADQRTDDDAVQAQLCGKAQAASEPELIRMLVEIALLPSGYSHAELNSEDPLSDAARRYGVDSKKPKPGASPNDRKKNPKVNKAGAKGTPNRNGSKKGGAA